MLNDKILFIEKLYKLANLIKSSDNNFYDHVCNFIVEEFDLYASAIFEITGKEFLILGKSSNVKKSFINGSKLNCPNCKVNEGRINGFYTDAECSINISEFIVYEGCYSFNYNDKKYLLKSAQKNPFTKVDINNLKTITDFITEYLISASSKYEFNKLSTANIITQISQELRSPINSIVGFSSILNEDSLSSSQSEYVSTIKSNAQNILLSINDLIEISKIESGASNVNKTKIELKELLDDIVKVFDQKVDKSILEFTIDDSDAPAHVFTDKQKLRFILNNLFGQLVRLTPKGKISIKIYGENKDQFGIDIKSTIKNIPANIIDKVFDPYVLIPFENTVGQNQNGLCLTLTKKYSDLLGAKLTALKNDQEIQFNFMLSEEKTESSFTDIKKKLSVIPAPETSTSNKVLVVEDDYATAKLLGNYLTKWGYDPHIVNTAEQTLSIIEKEKFLAVIMDIALPNSNGLELLKTLNEHNRTKNTPVIVCSVESEQQKAFMMGAVEYFVKPIKYNFLVEVLQSYKLKKDAKVLCVDDDLPTLNLVKQAIESAGFNPVAINVSAEVLETIKDMDIDLAIVDLDMPDPNGFELIKLIKSEKKFEKLPIVIYTGKENFQDDLKKIDGLFEDLLSKRSTNIEDLADTIKQMINRYDTPAKPEEIENKTDGTKILLAEDYKHSQIIVTRLLKKNGFEDVVVVENGQDALELAKKQKFNLILMDMQMPVMNGFEATEKIRLVEGYSDTPIVALTAFAMKGDREKCLNAGATDYIPKPIDSKEFIEKVKYYTGVKEGA